MVIRTYLCRRCGTERDYSDEPERCADCGHGDLQWIPRGGHPLRTLRRRDRLIRQLAEAHGLSNLRSARPGEPMAPPSAAQPRVMEGVSLKTLNLEAANAMIGKVGAAAERPRGPNLKQMTNVIARFTRDGKEMPGDQS